MSPGRISRRVVADRLDWINKMIGEIETLSLDSYETFASDKRNIWSAESCLRRSLEALMDLGRHIIAKGFGRGVSEYKEIASEMEKEKVLNAKDSAIFKTMAGYRNRMVHFYHEISDKELFEICSSQLSDITYISGVIKKWINDHPEFINGTL
ncbi:MAG: hypothetical protein DRG35_04505 [Deltaproteobacteria bacterium]|nr:MAG: hypothetical protein B6I32_05285 [Desulfobacterium sp. 4572_20]RLB15092.1 MAG: hypothetical protein DRG35_04505 [Deltaproteobacteria bacterium]